MYGFSIVSISPTSGYICLRTDNEQKLIAYNQSSIASWLESFKNCVLYTNDSREAYRALSFLGPDVLRTIPFFDNKMFFNVYKNLLDIDLTQIAEKHYSISLGAERDRLQKIWNLQGSYSWSLIPTALIEVYLEKEALASYKIGEPLSKIKLDMDQSHYLDFFKDFLIYLSILEDNGIFDKQLQKIVPRYEYDRASTGRIVNIEPFCYQSQKTKFIETYISRFGTEGTIIIADWKNADFRVAAALSQEKIEGEKKDPYTLLGKKLLNKDDITYEEREKLKNEILSIMYGYEKEHSELFFNTYPNISKFKTHIIEEARKNRKLTTIFGKSRYFNKDDKFETKAFNTINQMTVADLCKKAVIELQREFSQKQLKSVPIPFIVYDQFAVDLYLPELELVKEALYQALIVNTIPNNFKQFVDFEISITDIYSGSTL